MRESCQVSNFTYWFHKLFFPLKETRELEQAPGLQELEVQIVKEVSSFPSS